MSNMPSFHNVVRDRRSVRSFLPTPVAESVIKSVVQDAQLAPSNCNTQPWQVHIVSGAKRDALSKAILAADDAGLYTPDFVFDLANYRDRCSERAKAQGAAYYKAIGVSREANEDRRTAARFNLEFFGAPHVALLFMPEVGDNVVRVAGDIGMYGQTFLLSLTAHGLGGIPQTMLGFYAQTIRDVLGIDPSSKMLFGISFGFPDMNAVGSDYRIDKDPPEASVTYHS